MIALLVMTDGRRACLAETFKSFAENTDQSLVGQVFVHDDSNDPDYRAELVDWSISMSGMYVFGPKPGSGKLGFGGAIRSAWDVIRTHTDARYIFHLEDDFTFNRPVPLADMVQVLATQPDLVQLALRRQPWNDDERRAGGVVELDPEGFSEHSAWFPWSHDGYEEERVVVWLEHRKFWTTNPSLYRRSLILANDWPEGPQSEGVFSAKLREDPHAVFGYWGSRSSGEWVHHIGDERVGTGY